jgi:hypothetical protein
MKNNPFIRFSPLTFLIVCILLMTAGCNRPEDVWSTGTSTGENQQKMLTGAEELAILNQVSIRYDGLLESLEGTASKEKMQLLMDNLIEKKLGHVTEDQRKAIQNNQKQITSLTAEARTGLEKLTTRLEELSQQGILPTRNQTIMLNTLITEYADDIENMLASVEARKESLMNRVDLETLAGFSPFDFILMRKDEIEALSTLRDLMGTVYYVLNLD